MSKEYKKVLVFIFCIVFVLMSIWTSIVAMDTIHTKHCYVGNCSACNIIHLSASFTRNIGLVYFCILFLILLLKFRKLIFYVTKTIKKLTLVELKVIQIK